MTTQTLRKNRRIILVCLAMAGGVFNACGQSFSLGVILATPDSVLRMPENGPDGVWVRFSCIVKNNTADTLYLLGTRGLGIYPHPWSVSVNGLEETFWSGDPRCSGLHEEDILTLAPMDTVHQFFAWSCFHKNFSATPGTYKVKARYHFTAPKKGGARKEQVYVSSDYSNEVVIEIKK